MSFCTQSSLLVLAVAVYYSLDGSVIRQRTMLHRVRVVLNTQIREADTIPTDSVPTDAIPTICSQEDPVHL